MQGLLCRRLISWVWGSEPASPALRLLTELSGSWLRSCNSGPGSTGTVWDWTPGSNRCLEFPQLVSDIHILVSIFVTTENIVFTYEYWRRFSCTALAPLYVIQNFWLVRSFENVFQWDLDWNQISSRRKEILLLRLFCFLQIDCYRSLFIVVNGPEISLESYLKTQSLSQFMWCWHFYAESEKKFWVFFNLKEGTRVCENVSALYLIPVSRVIVGKKLVPFLPCPPALPTPPRITSVAL